MDGCLQALWFGAGHYRYKMQKTALMQERFREGDCRAPVGGQNRAPVDTRPDVSTSTLECSGGARSPP